MFIVMVIKKIKNKDKQSVAKELELNWIYQILKKNVAEFKD